jgi:hypothetical protein
MRAHRHDSAISRRNAPELYSASSPRTWRAQGRPGARRPHGPRASEKHGAGTTGLADYRPSLRNGFNAYIALSPGTGCLAPVARMLVKATGLDLSTGRPGPHDFASVLAPIVCRRSHVHRSPPYVRDDAYAPVDEAGWVQERHVFPKTKAEYFSRAIWTANGALKSLAKFADWRRLFRTCLFARLRSAGTKSRR